MKIKNQPNSFFILFFLLVFTITSCKNKKNGINQIKSSSDKEIRIKYAEKLNTNELSIKNTKLYSFIDDWYGTPYKYGGIDKNGIDCSGFVFKLFEQVYSIKSPRTTTELYEVSNEIKKKDLKEGDLIFFKIDSKKVSHVGIFLMNNKFVHASSKKGIMISDLNEEFFVKCFYKGGRLK
jgi:lipoprotein Spr/probable lipoprotein NlpC